MCFRLLSALRLRGANPGGHFDPSSAAAARRGSANYSATFARGVDCPRRRGHSCAVARSLLSIFLLVCLACAPDPGELSPSAALKSFLTALDRSPHAPEQLVVAFGWIDAKSRAALAERAELAAALAGRSVSATDMLVAGRNSFSGYSVASLRMRTRLDGERATVVVTVQGQPDIEVPLVREEGRWRVVLTLPEKKK